MVSCQETVVVLHAVARMADLVGAGPVFGAISGIFFTRQFGPVRRTATYHSPAGVTQDSRHPALVWSSTVHVSLWPYCSPRVGGRPPELCAVFAQGAFGGIGVSGPGWSKVRGAWFDPTVMRPRLLSQRNMPG